MNVRWQSDQLCTEESVCDKPYHTNKRNVQKEEDMEVLRNYALLYL